ncbi:MAG: outer membrane protein assembly factor BamA [Phycisphaerales bacterium]
MSFRTVPTPAAILIALLGAAPALAQSTPPGPAAPPAPVAPPGLPPALLAYEGRPVAHVTFARSARDGQARPLEADLEQLARNQLRLREGSPFAPQTVSEDVARLNRLGRFRTVEASVRPNADNSVDLVYTLEPGPVIAAVQTVGNTVIADQDLQKSIDVLVGTPVDPVQLDRACRRIEASYREKGYYNTRVVVDEKELAAGVALFQVREGERTKITEIRFRGNDTVSARELRSKIESSAYFPILDTGEVDEQKLADDAALIVNFYKDRGQIDARAAYTLTPSADGSEVVVEFVIEEGQVYTLRDVKVVYDDGDQHVFSPEQVVGLMEVKPGDVYSAARLKKSLDAVVAGYGKLGYTDVAVTRRELRAGDGPAVDLVLAVREGLRYKTGVVEVTGNTITRDDVVRRHIQLLPDRPLDSTAARETEQRLKQTRLFDPNSVRVAVQPEDPENPGYRDVIVEVAETNTGSFNFGASVGSDSGVLGTISLEQRNFDVTDTPDTFSEFFNGEAFRGAGQTFSIAIQPGDRVRNFTLGLSEPALLGTDYSGSARASFRQRIYRSYDEQRYGATFSVGRRFGSRWSVQFPLRLENVELSNIDDGSPTDYFDVQDTRTLASIGATLSRTTLDREMYPTSGTKASFGITQYGLIGDDTFTLLSAEYSKYFKLEEDVVGDATTLLFRTSVQYIPGDTDVAPFYERLYLGGQNFRGFALRGASPVGRDSSGNITDDPVGGNFLFFTGLELTRPIFEQTLAGVVFLDTGTVETDFGLSDYRVSAGFGVRIAVPYFGAVPLAFDFGFPLLKQDTDRERLFTFTIDVPFR